MEQSIRFTSIGGRRVAWAAVGDGPPLVVASWWMSHLELDWRDARFRAFIDALAAHRTVVRYDRPGTGLSDRDGPPPTTCDQEVELLTGIVGELGAGPFALLGGSSGGPVAAAYAARRPERVERLILYGAYADGARIAPAAVRESMVATIRAHWGLGSRLLADVFLPGADAAEREAFARFQREAAPAETAALSLEAVYGFRIVAAAERIETPTLVLHRRNDATIPFELGRELASRIDGASFQPLEGAEHFPWRGDAPTLLRSTLAFLGVPEAQIEGDLGAAGDDWIEPGDARASRVETDLSARELEVLALVAKGLSDEQIAERLVLSPHTVHRHVANIRTKLRLPSRAAAAAHAARLGLI